MVLEQATPDKQLEITRAYQAALKRNPRFIPARLALARYLIKHDHQEHAFQLLQDGLAYSYRQLSPAYLELVEMTSSAAIDTGNTELADYLSGLLATSRKDFAAMISRQDQRNIINPY